MDTLKNIIKGTVISFIFTLIALLILATLLVYTNLSESCEDIVIIVVTGISILIGSSIGNKKNNKNGIINGAFIGIMYIGGMYIISSLIGKGFRINGESLILMGVGIVTGMIGGIIGINSKK